MTQNEPQAPEPISLQEQPNQETMQDGEHKRVNDILLGFLERPALNYLAKHMPAWVWPDTLTAIGVVGSAIVLVGYILAGFGELKGNWFLHLSSLGFVINWFGDSLDGTLARYRHIERPRYGFFMDHSIDGFSACAMILGIGLSGMSTFEMATFALIGYLLSMIVTYLKTHATGDFEMTAMRVGPTEARVLAYSSIPGCFLRQPAHRHQSNWTTGPGRTAERGYDRHVCDRCDFGGLLHLARI